MTEVITWQSTWTNSQFVVNREVLGLLSRTSTLGSVQQQNRMPRRRHCSLGFVLFLTICCCQKSSKSWEATIRISCRSVTAMNDDNKLYCHYHFNVETSVSLHVQSNLLSTRGGIVHITQNEWMLWRVQTWWCVTVPATACQQLAVAQRDSIALGSRASIKQNNNSASC